MRNLYYIFHCYAKETVEWIIIFPDMFLFNNVLQKYIALDLNNTLFVYYSICHDVLNNVICFDVLNLFCMYYHDAVYLLFKEQKIISGLNKYCFCH